jgi:hypothetical protein
METRMPRTSKRVNPRDKRSVLLEALGPAATDFGKQVHPLGKEVGALTVRTVRALLKPVGALVWGFEKVEDWIAETVAPKLADVPDQERIEPKLTIAGPTIDAMKYYGSESDLRDLFANLLVCSMDARTAATAHPAFVEIIKQLSPDEAKMLKYLARRAHTTYPIIYVSRCRRALKHDTTSFETEIVADDIFGPYSILGRYAGCLHLSLLPSYITNLVRMQVINLDTEQIYDELRDELLDDEVIKRYKARYGTREYEYRDKTGYMITTPLGDKFLDACVRHRLYDNC